MKLERKGRAGKNSVLLTLVAALSLITNGCLLVHRRNDTGPRDYSPLITFIQDEDRTEPLYDFDDSVGEFDEKSHEASLEYFNNHPELMKKIQSELDHGVIRWRLDYLRQKLLFVPEQRAGYAALFEDYCKDVVGELLRKTGFMNPYRDILTLGRGRPERSTEGEGVTAFLVHNLVNEYAARYVFYNQKDKKVRIDLRGRVLVGEVGFYKTHIYRREDGTFELKNDDFTIWQNSAENPYTALMTPVEETFHILLREDTENAISDNINWNSVKSMKEVKRISNNWMAVEEAVVGGVVHALFPRLLEEYISDIPEDWIGDDLKSKHQFRRYRYLQSGIEIVRNMGYQDALRIYTADPKQFKRLLDTAGSNRSQTESG